MEQSDDLTESVSAPEHQLALRIVGRQAQLELLVQGLAERLIDLFPVRGADRRPRTLGAHARRSPATSPDPASLGEAVMENWQSEYLQFMLFMLATVWLLQRAVPVCSKTSMRTSENARTIDLKH